MRESKTQHELSWLPRSVALYQDTLEFKQHLRAAGPSLWWSKFRDLVADAICEYRVKLSRRHRQETGGRYVSD